MYLECFSSCIGSVFVLSFPEGAGRLQCCSNRWEGLFWDQNQTGMKRLKLGEGVLWGPDRHAYCVHKCKQAAKMLPFVWTCNVARTASLTQTGLSLDFEGYPPLPPQFPPVYVLFIFPMKIKFSSCTGRAWMGVEAVVGYLFLTLVKSRHLVEGMEEEGENNNREMRFISDICKKSILSTLIICSRSHTAILSGSSGRGFYMWWNTIW